MNEFYESLTGTLFYRWILLNQKEYEKHHVQTLVKEENDCRIIFFESDEKFGRITIWNNNVVEEQLYRKKDGSSAFYLHFEIDNIGQCRYLFLEFYHCLVKHSAGRRFKVLVCCTGGLTSCLYAAKLQELADLKRYNIRIDATAFTYLNKRYDSYDLIFLAPQVAHKAAQVKMEVPRDIPVRNINPTDYATLDLDYTFNQICDLATVKGLLH